MKQQIIFVHPLKNPLSKLKKGQVQTDDTSVGLVPLLLFDFGRGIIVNHDSK